MTAETVLIDPSDLHPAFRRCRDIILAGGAVIYPTDTFYALGVDPARVSAVERLFRIKGRASDQPILLLVHDSSEVGKWAAAVPPEAKKLMDRYWPGPLTLVFQAQPWVSPLLTAGTGTIAVRVPGSMLTRELLAAVGHALTGTSANRSGQEAVRTAGEALNSVGGMVDLVLDAGATPGILPSTIVEVKNGRIRVIREGAVRL